MGSIRIAFCVLIALTSFAAFAGTAAEDCDNENQIDISGARTIWRELRRSPCWLDINEDEVELRAGITRIYAAISRFNTSTIKEGISLYLAESRNDSAAWFYAQAKVFAYLRVVFDVPQGLLKDVTSFGNWGAPMEDGRIDLLWPYAQQNNGQLLLTGVFGGEYAGPPYDALAEVDYFDGRFPRRTHGPRKEIPTIHRND